jgi:phospholipase C
MATAPDSLEKIKHVIVIFQENWSFDGLYGKFPAANGISAAGTTIRQVDKLGQAYATLPQPMDTTHSPPNS